MSIEQLLATTSHRELIEGLAYYQMEPWGHELLNILAANIAAAIMASQGVKNVKIKDYELDFDPEEKALRPQSIDEMKAEAMKLCIAFGGTINGVQQKPAQPPLKILNPHQNNG